MQDGVIKGTGNSRLLKSNVAAETTWDQALAMLNAGTFPIDLLFNEAGWDVLGTLLNKASLLSDEVAGICGLTGSDATPSNAIKIALPVGSVIVSACSTVPEGFLECNGATINRTTYANLFAKIGTTYGSGDGSTTFNVPDLRGEFLRGWDHEKGTDTGRIIGSSQESTKLVMGAFNMISRITNGENENTETASAAGTSTTTSGTQYEIRPRNIAMMYCIKY